MKLCGVRSELENALKEHQAAFGLSLERAVIDKLADHYELVQAANPLLHLVAPCPAREFAVRHVLESLLLMRFLPDNTCFADVGPGGGFPSIPCLIAREHLSAVLIESKEKKSAFLSDALLRLGLGQRAHVENKQFSEVTEKPFTHVASRALDRFSDVLPKLLRWAGDRTFLLFGGPSLEDALKSNGVRFERHLVPLSAQRYLFVGHKQKG